METADRRSQAARTRRAGRIIGQKTGTTDPPGPGKGRSKTAGRAGPGRRRHAGTGAADPGRLAGRPHAGGHRAGIPALAGGRPACYHRPAARPAQDGAIGDSTPHADSETRKIDPARLRFDDGAASAVGRRSRKIAVQHSVCAETPTSRGARERDWQKFGMNADWPAFGGHAKPVRDSRLKSRACGSKTGGASRSFGRIGESRLGLWLPRSTCSRPTGHDRTGRNVNARNSRR